MRINIANPQLRLLQLVVMLFFCQLWWEIGGFTVRAEDLLMIVVWAVTLLSVVVQLRMRYRRVALNKPLLAWIGVLLFGSLVAFFQPLSADIKKDSIINVIRLGFGLSTFFLMLNHPASPRAKIRAVFQAVIGFSFITTVVCLLQIGYWDGWLTIPLPELLTQIRDGADDEQGREIFGLFVGNTGTHIWTGMIAVQALAVLSIGRISTHRIVRYGWYAYFLLLALIIVRTSVRNSILGLFIAFFALIVIRSLQNRYLLNRLGKVLFVGLAVLAVVIGIFQVAPDSYFVERIRRAIPQLENGQIVIHPGSNVFGRLEFARIGLELFAERPITGQGFFAYAALAQQRTIFQVVHAHNSYIQTLAELGAIGFVVLLWLIWTMGWRLWRIYSMPTSDPLIHAARNWLVGVAIFMSFTGFFSNPFWEPQQMGVLFLLCGIMFHWYSEQPVPVRQFAEQSALAGQAV